MRTHATGLALIKSFEGFSPKAYFDDKCGKWTIGYGTTLEVNPGDTCTEATAEEWFKRDVEGTEHLLLACLPDVPLTENQLSALVSFCYNIGMGKWGVKDGFRELKGGGTSTMRKKLLVKDYSGAALQFPMWCKAGGIAMAGLLRRRLAEQALFNLQDFWTNKEHA